MASGMTASPGAERLCTYNRPAVTHDISKIHRVIEVWLGWIPTSCDDCRAVCARVLKGFGFVEEPATMLLTERQTRGLWCTEICMFISIQP